MRGALALAIVFAASLHAAASPIQMIHVQRPLSDVVVEIGDNLVERLKAWAPAPPDLGVLTTEPVFRTESSGYGWRDDPKQHYRKFHHGADYRGRPGTAIFAAGDGTVIFAGRRGGYGNVVFID